MLPPFLNPGDLIAICAPARKVSREDIGSAIVMLKSWGFRVKESPHLYGAFHQFSGTDDERASDFQWAMDDPDVKAIISARGGYGFVRLIDRLDFTSFRKYPKWMVGFSDLTVLNSHLITQFGIASIHAPMMYNLTGDRLNTEAADCLKKVLTGEPIRYHISGDPSLLPLYRKGNAKGVLVGGNLSILYSIAGSLSDLDTHDKILFLEDLDEYLYHIDRMMQQLKRNGKLSGLAGMIVGGMNDMRDNTIPYGFSAERIIADAVEEYDFPLCFGFPAGHISRNLPLILGGEVALEVTDSIHLGFEYGGT
ncbi:LD-carboxypeptidase [soil metagenome]